MRALPINRFAAPLGAVFVGSILFAASFPNPLAAGGVPILGWIAFVPAFWLVRRVGRGACVFWGALYGYASYGLFNYWLVVFNPLAAFVAWMIHLLYFAILFPALHLAFTLFPRRGYILQWILFLAYEFLRTQGFLGYSYGVSGYSQWSLPRIIQIADIFGVWGVSALVVFPSAFLGAALEGWSWKRGIRENLGLLRGFCFRERAPLCVWLCALAAALIYGFTAPEDYVGAPSMRIALIQHNADPWRGGLAESRRDYQVLKRLSQEASSAQDRPDLIVWPETAFTPRIYWHNTYRDDQPSYLLVREFLDFLKSEEVPYLVGNDDARLEPNEQGDMERTDYNAALLFHRGELLGQYRKLHLVPFTEHFPYRKQFPWIYQALIEADTHFWEKGSEFTVFSLDGVQFSAPICFEDTFGYLSRNFVRAGADVLVNITNDAWAKSLPAQMQHMTMAVFRAVENRRSLVRSAASGQTCGIDPNGRIIAMAEPFQEAQLTLDAPLGTKISLYTRYGDILGLLFPILGVAILLAGIARGIIRIILQGRSA